MSRGRVCAGSLAALLVGVTTACRRKPVEYDCNCDPVEYTAVCVEDGDYAAAPTGDTGAPPAYTGLTIAGDRVVLHRADGTTVTLDVVEAGPNLWDLEDDEAVAAYEAGCE